MKKSGQCPKCNSYEVFTNSESIKYGERAYISINGWRRFKVDVYVCVQCGYLEEYVSKKSMEDSKVMERIKENFKKVG